MSTILAVQVTNLRGKVIDPISKLSCTLILKSFYPLSMTVCFSLYLLPFIDTDRNDQGNSYKSDGVPI